MLKILPFMSRQLLSKCWNLMWLSHFPISISNIIRYMAFKNEKKRQKLQQLTKLKSDKSDFCDFKKSKIIRVEYGRNGSVWNGMLDFWPCKCKQIPSLRFPINLHLCHTLAFQLPFPHLAQIFIRTAIPLLALRVP